jgi:hypothetical protein
MPLCALLKRPKDQWALNYFHFEHAMAHRVNLMVMSPLTRFSAVPYFYEPEQNLAPPARLVPGTARPSNWHLNHQQAHNDALNEVPTVYITTPQKGVLSQVNVVDTNLDDIERTTWWTFVNHHNHYTTEGAILPIPPPPHPPPIPYVPTFW